MSIVVKGMKMPPCCMECPLEIGGRCGGLCGEYLPRDFRGLEDRPRFCPLEENESAHGEWVEETDRYHRWHCSHCGYVIGILKMDSNYCPRCGAIMDGGKRE